MVLSALRDRLKLSEPIDDRSLINNHVARVEVQTERLLVRLARGQEPDRESPADDTLYIGWQKGPSKRRREILLPESATPENTRPIRAETRATLVASIARGRGWLAELTKDAGTSTESIAQREGCSARKVNMTMSLAFLAPDLVKAALEGRLPHRMGVSRLVDLPAEWSRQRQMLGLPAL